VAAVLFLLRAPLLSGIAEAWMVNAPLAKSDAIVVLGGDPNSRAFEAVRLVSRRLGSANSRDEPRLSATDRLGITISQAELTAPDSDQRGSGRGDSNSRPPISTAPSGRQ